VEPAALRAAFPDAGARLAVFLHGLTESEASWCFHAEQHHGRRDVSYGTQLRDDLGLTPVYLRYNTGLHISENGRSLARLDEAELAGHRAHDVALVFQSNNLWPMLSARPVMP